MPEWLTIESAILVVCVIAVGVIVWGEWLGDYVRRWRAPDAPGNEPWPVVLGYYEGLYDSLPCEESRTKLRAVWPHLEQLVCRDGDEAK